MTYKDLSLFALVRVRVLGRGRHVSQRHVSDITHVPSRSVMFESRASTSAGKRGWRLTLSPQYPTCAFSALLPNTAAHTPSSHYWATAHQTNTCCLPSYRLPSSTPLLGDPNLSNGNPRNTNYPTHSLTRLAFSFPNIVTLVERDATMTMNTTNIKAFTIWETPPLRRTTLRCSAKKAPLK